MKSRLQNRLFFGLLLAFLAFDAQKSIAQQLGEITPTSASCRLDIPVCNGDTILLEPTNTTNYTNFQWYFGSVAPANLISGPSAAQGVVSVSNDSLIVVVPGGMYIMTGEYAMPSGCTAINDTITLDFQPVPSLSTVPDTICTAAPVKAIPSTRALGWQISNGSRTANPS